MVDAEESTAEKTTPTGRDSSERTGLSSADYVVDDKENRDRQKRDANTEIYWGLASASAPKENLDQKTVMPKGSAKNRQ